MGPCVRGWWDVFLSGGCRRNEVEIRTLSASAVVFGVLFGVLFGVVTRCVFVYM